MNVCKDKSGFLRCGTERTHRHTYKRAHQTPACTCTNLPIYSHTYIPTHAYINTPTTHTVAQSCTRMHKTHIPSPHSGHLKEQALLSCVRIPLLCHYSQERPGRDRSPHTSYAALTAESTDNQHYYTSYIRMYVLMISIAVTIPQYYIASMAAITSPIHYCVHGNYHFTNTHYCAHGNHICIHGSPSYKR